MDSVAVSIIDLDKFPSQARIIFFFLAPNIVIFNLTYSRLAAVQYAVELLEIINSFSTLLKILYVITA